MIIIIYYGSKTKIFEFLKNVILNTTNLDVFVFEL